MGCITRKRRERRSFKTDLVTSTVENIETESEVKFVEEETLIVEDYVPTIDEDIFTLKEDEDEEVYVDRTIEQEKKLEQKMAREKEEETKKKPGRPSKRK